MSNSPQNNTNRLDHTSPKFQCTDNFIPLGFSSPINQKQSPSDNFGPHRNTGYFSTNRHQNQRGNYRNRYTPNQRRSNDNRPQQQNYNRKQPFNRQNDQNVQPYFHPSMLEDPWKDLVAKIESEKFGNTPKSDEDENQSSDESTKRDGSK